MPAGTDKAGDVSLHDNLQHALGNAAKEITVFGLHHRLGKALPSEVEGASLSSVIGKNSSGVVKLDASTLTDEPDDHRAADAGVGLGPTRHTARWDFTGYTAYSLIENHVQSYAFVLKGVDHAMERTLHPVLPRNFVYDRYKDVVFQQETRLARVASRSISVGAKCYSHHRSSSEPAFFCALSLLDTGFPFLKKSLLHKMPGIYDPYIIADVL